MTIALDIGSWRIRSLRRREDRLVSRNCRSVYAALGDTETRRGLLEQVQIPYAVCDDGLVLLGDAASEFSRMFGTPCAAILPDGVVPADDPPARQVAAALIDALLPEPQYAGQLCCLTVPGGFCDKAKAGEAFFTRLIRLKSYAPIVQSPGMAVVLAELVSDSFTGLGMTIGAATTEISLAHRGVEIARTCAPRGGNWIDQQLAAEQKQYAFDAAGARYLDTDAASLWKEEFQGSLTEPADDRAALLADLTNELVGDALKTAAREFAAVRAVHDVPQPLSLVVCGGPTSMSGFEVIFERALRKTPFPLDVQSVRVASDPEFTVARGCLIRAEFEAQHAQKPQALRAAG